VGGGCKAFREKYRAGGGWEGIQILCLPHSLHKGRNCRDVFKGTPDWQRGKETVHSVSAKKKVG